MKPIRHITIGAALTMLLALSYSAVQAKNAVEKKAYMFGFSASFNDSIVYFTNIQEVDSVWFIQKKDMLAGRSSYSSQLRDYFNKLNQPKRTCIVVGSKSLKKVEKKYEKMKKLYTQNKKATYDVRFIPAEDFKFVTVNMGGSKEEVAPTKPEKYGSKPHPSPKLAPG